MKVLECGTKTWFLPSKGEYYFHNLNGPAVEMVDGHKEWIVNGMPHRFDGPAIELPAYTDDDGCFHEATVEWWINGNELPQDEVEKWLKENEIDLKTEIGQLAFKLMWS